MDTGTYHYNSDGEVRNRTIEWARKNVFNHEFWDSIGRLDSILDVGCGNGRFNQIWVEKFKNIVCIDRYEELDERFALPNVNFHKLSFDEFETEEKFDCVSLMQIMYLWGYGGKYSLEKAVSLLKPDGFIFVMDDDKRVVDGYVHMRLEKGTYDLDTMIEQLKLKSINYVTNDPATRCSIIRREE